MADSQPQQPNAGQGQQGQQHLFRPDDILKLTCLPDDEKQKYRLIMQNFWSIFNTNPAGTSENTNARGKIAEWSSKFLARESQYRRKMKAQQQQQQGNQGQPSQSNPAGQQNQNPVKQEAAQALNRGAEGVAGPVSHNSQGPQPPPAQGQNPGRGQVDPAIFKHVHEFPMQGPLNGPAIGTPEYEKKLQEYRNGYLNMLAKQSSLSENRRKIITQLSERQSKGQEIPQDLLVLKNKCEEEHAKMKEQINRFRGLQKQWKDEREGNGQGPQAQPQGQNPAQSPPQQQPQQPPPPQQQAQQMQRQPSQPNMNAQPQIKEEPQIKIEGGQAPQPQPQAQPQQQFNPQVNHQQAPPPQQQNQQQFPPSLPQQQQVRPPAPHPQTMPPNQQQMPQFTQQNQPQQFHHQQQQQRPQINPMQANAHPQSNSPHPQSANSTAPGMNGPPVPLSHQAAVSAANRSYTDPARTQTPISHPGQQQPNGGGNFGSREREQLNNPKMPIPRHLNVTSPSGVHMGQSRPTMSGPTNGAPGPMGQPVIPRPPPFQLEGEGDRVLSKRKLDELVRQVTGGGEESLTSEVEEAVLQLADDFIDSVISSACKLSKLRDSPQLDIRDIQVILERNYNIRIPGYASDEVRTVRKIVPAQGWVSKMAAVSAAKVMGGRGGE